jgi:ZIP family zinc transporter
LGEVQGGFVAALLGNFLPSVLGALAVLLIPTVDGRTRRILLAFAAGVMLAASIFSLLLPSFETAEPLFTSNAFGSAVVLGVVCLGALGVASIHALTPHAHLDHRREGPRSARIRGVWLFVWAIVLHNIPEGLAVGVSATGQGLAESSGLIIGIGLQNLPEGLAISASLLSIGYPLGRCIGVGVIAGAAEAATAVAAALTVASAAALLPWALALAAGAMLYVVCTEVLPETHDGPHAGPASVALFTGFTLMAYLDRVLN